MADANASGPLELTLAAAAKQPQTVTTDGAPIAPMLDGVRRFSVPTHVDDRGFLVEAFDPRWSFVDEPIVYSYVTTVVPGHAKGWGLHKKHSDRYFLLFG